LSRKRDACDDCRGTRRFRSVKLDRILTWVIWGWLALFFLSRVLVVIGLVLVGVSPWEALRSEALSLLGGFNPLSGPYFLVRVVVLSPAIIAFIWKQIRRRRLRRQIAN
jgi:hypothetical protein